MSETFGLFRGRAVALPHGAGVNSDVFNGYLNSRYDFMRRYFPWSRLEGDEFLAVLAKYDTGTVALTLDQTTCVGTGTIWTAAMTGFRFRPVGRNEFYIVTYVSPTSFTLDRAYEGPTLTAAAYRGWQPIYKLPSGTSGLISIKDLSDRRRLNKTTQQEFDFLDPSRANYGQPLAWATYKDASDGRAQIELYPGPADREGLPIRVITGPQVFTDADTGTAFPDWVDTGTLMAGLEADLYGLQGSLQMKIAKERDWMEGLALMAQEDCRRRPPSVLKMADRFVQHRVDRALGENSLAARRRDLM